MSSKADIVIKSSTIFTGNTLEPVAGAVVIRDGRIIDVLSEHEADEHIGFETRVIDAGDALVCPGFNDAHTHFLQNGIMKDAEYTLSLEGLTSKAEVSEAIRGFAAQHPENKWIVGCDLNFDSWENGEKPTKELLDELVPDRPAYFASWDMHTGWTNSAGLAAAGYTAGMPDPDGGYIGRNDDGSLSGLNFEPPANDPVWGLANVSCDMDRALNASFNECLSHGVTAAGVVWPYGGIEEHDNMRIFNEFDAEGKLPIRLSLFPKMTDGLEGARWCQDNIIGDHVRFAGVKLITDGVCEAHTGYLTEPYADDSSTCGEPTVAYDELLSLVRQADAAGYSVRLHCIGNGAVKQALDVFERVGKEQGFKGHHNCIEHIETCCPDDVERFAQLGVIASMQPIHSVLNVEGYPALLGEKWIPYMWPQKSLLDSHAIVAFGTDAPVWNFNPMEGIYAAITRQQPWDAQPEGGFVPEQRITLAQALQAYTYGAAYAEGYEHEIGSIERGKLADIVVMDRNLFTAAPEESLEAKVALTIVDGQVVYEA